LLSDVNEVIGGCFVEEFEDKKISEILFKAWHYMEKVISCH
jgi:hypothetical protein